MSLVEACTSILRDTNMNPETMLAYTLFRTLSALYGTSGPERTYGRHIRHCWLRTRAYFWPSAQDSRKDPALCSPIPLPFHDA